MNAKEVFKAKVEKLKTLLAVAFEDIQPAAPDTTGADTLKEYTTDAGVVVKIDKLDIGGYVYMQDGTTPVTAGFTLSDGTIVTVDENGLITSVVVPVAQPVAAADPAAVPLAAAPAPLPAVPAPAYDARFEAIEKELAELKSAQATKFSAAEAKDKKTGEMLSQILSLVEKFGEAASDDPAQPPSGEPAIQSKSERAAMLIKSIKETRKVTGVK